MNVNDAIQLEHHRWHNPTPFGASSLGWFLDRPRSYSPSICLHQWVGVREHLREPPVLHEQNMEKQNTGNQETNPTNHMFPSLDCQVKIFPIDLLEKTQNRPGTHNTRELSCLGEFEALRLQGKCFSFIYFI